MPDAPDLTAIAEDIGDAADTVGNLFSALALPLPAERHVAALRASLPGLRDRLRAVYRTLTNDDPWSDTQTEEAKG